MRSINCKTGAFYGTAKQTGADRWRSPIRDLEIKTLLRAALTDRINDREVYMKGIDASCHYEGYQVFKTETLTPD